MKLRELDIAPDQVIDWLHAELRNGWTLPMLLSISREFATLDADTYGAGAGPDADVSAVSVSGILELRPKADPDAWVMRVQAEDPAGPHVPEYGSAPDEPEDIDLETFDESFIRADNADVAITLEYQDKDARKDFEALYARMLRDRHDV